MDPRRARNWSTYRAAFALAVALVLTSCEEPTQPGDDGNGGGNEAVALKLLAQPTGPVVAGTAMVFEVATVNGSGQTVPDNAVISLRLQGASGAVLGGNTTQGSFNGVARFSVTIDKAAAQYTVVAEASCCGQMTSGAFSVVAAAPAALTMTPAPS